MATLKLTSLSAYRDYFQAIAVSHTNIDGYKWGDKDVLMNDNRSDMAASILWAQPYENARYSDGFSDNIVKVKEALVAYMVTPDSELYADEDAALDTCEEVIEDIIAKMIKDKAGAEVTLQGGAKDWQMISVNISGIVGRPVETIIGSTKYIGWEIRIPFHDNTRFTYNSEKWQ